MQAFRWYPAGQTSRPLSSIASFSSLPDSPQFHARMNGKGLKLWSQRMCIILLQSTISSPYGHTYTRMHTYEEHTTSGRYRQNMVGPEKYRLWDAEKRNGFGENLSCFRSLEEHSLRETIECYRITRGASPGTDSSHAYSLDFNIEPSISSSILRVWGPGFWQWPTLVHTCRPLQLRGKWTRLNFFRFSDMQTNSTGEVV